MRRTIVVLGLLLLLAGGLIARPAALGTSAAQEPSQSPTTTQEPAPPTPTPPPTVTMTKGTPPPTSPPTVTMTPGCIPLVGVELSGPKACFAGLGCLFVAVPCPMEAAR